MILGIGCDLRFDCLLKLPKSPRNRTQLVLGLGCAKDGAPYSGSFSLSSNSSRT